MLLQVWGYFVVRLGTHTRDLCRIPDDHVVDYVGLYKELFDRV